MMSLRGSRLSVEGWWRRVAGVRRSRQSAPARRDVRPFADSRTSDLRATVLPVQFIRAIRVRDFRSLPLVDLADVDNMVPIVGPMGSGKSNLLRALNLFFNPGEGFPCGPVN
jgi:hypothetical protein